MKKNHLLILLLICLLLLLPVAVYGQQDPQLVQFIVSFWPEYDQPSMLVIYQVQLSAEVDLPAIVELPLPGGIPAPHAVALATADGALVNADYELIPSEQGQLLQVTAETPTVWVEYYQDLVIDGAQRSFSFHWPGTMTVDELNFEVQQPPSAQSLEVEPAPDGQRVGADGLTYLTGSFGSTETGDEIGLEINYQKATNDLTVAAQPEAPLPGVSTTPPELQDGPNWQLPALIGLAAILVGAIGLILWRRRKPTPRKGGSRRRAPVKKTPQRFCHNCGKQVGRADRFCRHCGVEQRSS